MWIAVFLLAVLQLANSQELSGPDLSEAGPGNLNAYLDQVIQETTSKFAEHGVDPMDLPDSQNTFKEKVLFVTVSGGFRTTKGRLRGLQSLRRAGDSTLSIENNVVKAEAVLSVNNLDVSSDARAWFGKLNVNFHMGAKVQNLRATVKVEVPLDAEGGKPRATSFVVNSVGKISPNFNNIGPLNWVLEKSSGVFMKAIHNLINKSFSPKILNALNKEIGKVNLQDLAG